MKKETISILLIEKNPGDANFIKKLLKEVYDQSYTIEWTDSLKSSILEISQNEFDIVLLNLDLPDSNGLETLIKVFNKNPRIPIVVLTEVHDSQMAINTVKQGAQDYLSKEIINRDNLSRVIRYAIERNRIKIESQASEKKYSRLFQQSNDGIILHDLKGNVLDVNQRALNLFGYTKNEILDKKIRMLHPPSEYDLSKKAFKQVSKKGFAIFETKFVRKNGEIFIAEVSSSLFEINGKKVIQGIVRDITERKVTEQKLLLQDTALKSAANGIVITDKYGTILWVNAAFSELSGYSYDEAVGQNPRILKSDKQDKEFYRRLWGTILSGNVWQGEMINSKKDGALYNEEQTITPVKNKEGEITHFIGIKTDISKRKATENRLRESEDKFRSAFEHSPMGIALIGQDKKYLKANKTLSHILGYSEAELKAMTFLDITHPNDFLRDQMAFDQLFNGEIEFFKAEKRYIKKNTKFIWANINVSILKDEEGRVKYAITTIEDITERKKAEEGLRLFRTLIDHSNDSIMIIDPKAANILDVNVKTRLNLGYNRDELLSMTIFDIDPSINKHLFIKRGQEIDNSGSIVVEGTHKRKDGSIFPVEVNITKVQLDRDYGVTVARDITDRQKSEQAIHESEKKYRTIFEESKDTIYISTVEGEFVDINPAGVSLFGYDSAEELMAVNIKDSIYTNPRDRMKFQDTLKENGFVTDYEINLKKKNGEKLIVLVTASAVKDENDKITGYRGIIRDITKQKELERQLLQAQKMEAIGTLAGGIAHDFNNILGAILGYTELTIALVEEDRNENAIIRRNLEQVYRASLRAKDLIQHILTFSRQTEHKPQSIKINLILKEALKLLRASLPATIDIYQEIDTNPRYILGDPTQIHQIIMNLCTNAYDAMREKGGVLKVQLNPVEINEQQSAENININPGKYLKLTVSDTGMGMSDETIKRIFDPFFTTKEAGAGTGLGLSVVHGIVKNHYGEITVESKPGRGTTFNIYLPEFEPKEENASTENQELLIGTENILYIDDEESLVQTGKQILEKLGYKVTGKTRSSEALELFKQYPEQFDLVLTDQMMPKMTGIDLAKKILDIRPDIPIILITGYSEVMTRVQLRQMGIRDLIMKPILTADLSNAIRTVLDKH